MQALKRLVRFLKGSPRCLVVYNRQAERPIVDVFSDSDWAWCTKTQRSTSSSYVMLGGHLLAASATTQNVVATSSGEPEFYALTKSASRALSAVAVAADMSEVVEPRVRVDATVSKAIASRRGVGRVRHLHTQVLWVQEAAARRELTVVKVPGVDNPPDMGTKHLAERRMHECLKRAGCHITGGRSRTAFEVLTKDLSRWPCGYGNDRSRISIEIDKRSRTSVEIDKRSRTSVEMDNRSRTSCWIDDRLSAS